MRSRMHGTFATLLLMVPVLSIPALAIFGIPQFAPVVASPLEEVESNPDRERRIGQSARGGDDLLGEMEDAPRFGSNLAEHDHPSSSRMGESVPLTRPANPSQSLDEGEPRSRWQNDDGSGPRRFSDDHAGVPQRGQPMDHPPKDWQDSGTELLSPFEAGGSLPRNRQGDGSGGLTNQRDATRPGEPEHSESSPELTWQAAIRQLNDLEIRNYRLQPGLGEKQVLFICSYTPSHTPSISYRFEAEADDPLKAVEKVLAQVTEWRQRR